MPRPKTKRELLDLSQSNFDRLNTLVASYSKEELKSEFPKGTLNRNIRDVLAHVHHWHLMFLKWHSVGMEGGKPDMPAKGYTWRTLPDLNKGIWEKYNDISLKRSQSMLASSFNDVRELINIYSEEELFEKKRYKWTGSTSLAAYLISCTASHYDWAYKLLRKSMK